MRKILSILAAILGEAIIVTLILLISRDIPGEITALNIIVCTIAFALWARILFVKIDRSDDEVGSWVASLGIRLYGMLCYSFTAPVAAFLMNNTWILRDGFNRTEPVSLKIQILIQAAFLLLLVLTGVFAGAAGNQVSAVHEKEKDLTAGPDRMRAAVRRLSDTAFMTEGISPEVKASIDNLAADLRFLSPVGTAEAKEYEQKFVSDIDFLLPSFINYKMNEAFIIRQLSLLRRTFETRKSLHK